jgi:hypothetical protein
MKKIFVFVAVIAVFSAFIIIPSCQSGKASAGKMLKFNLEKGKGYDYEIIWDLETNIDTIKFSKINIAGLYAMEVIDDSAGIKTLSTVYKDLRMNIDMRGISMNIESNKPDTSGQDEANLPQKMMTKMFSAIIGKPFIIKADEEGNVIEVKGFDALITSMVDSVALSEDQKMIALATMKGQFNDEEIKNQFAQALTIFPNKEVKVGDSWEKSYAVGGQMPSKLAATYTVKQIEGDHVTMTSKAKISSGGSETQISGDQDGNIIVDSKTGLVINAEFKQDIQVNANGRKAKITGKGKIKGSAQ